MKPGNLAGCIQSELNAYLDARKTDWKTHDVAASRLFSERLANLLQLAEAFYFSTHAIPQKLGSQLFLCVRTQ
jgi:hypothetical protein